jgi:hypothetical protein
MTEARDLALPSGYTDLLGELKNRVRAARTQALRTVNTPSSSSCTGPSVERFWSARTMRAGGVGSSDGWQRTCGLSSRR